jgi:hypothetical protein
MLKTEVIDFSTVKAKYRNNLFYLIIRAEFELSRLARCTEKC